MRHTVATYFSSSGLCDNGTIAVKLILLVNTRSTVLYNVSQQNKVGFSKKKQESHHFMEIFFYIQPSA